MRTKIGKISGSRFLCFEQGTKSIQPPAVTSKEATQLSLPFLRIACHIPGHFCLERMNVLVTLHQPSLVPGGAITDTVTFVRATANKGTLRRH